MKTLDHKHMAPVRAAAAPTVGEFFIAAEAKIVAVEAAAGKTPERPSIAIHAYSGGMLRVSGYYAPVVVDCEGLHATKVAILKNHDTTLIVGQGEATITATDVDIAGIITGDITDKSTAAGDVVLQSRNGFVWQASIGVSPERVEWVEQDATAKANRRQWKGPLYIIRAGRLGETSLLAVGADETASAKIAAHAAHSWKGEIDMNFDDYVRSFGFDPATITEDQRVKCRARYDSEQALKASAAAAKTTGVQDPPAKKPEPVAAEAQGSIEQLVADEEADRERRAGITRLAATAIKVEGSNLAGIKDVAAKAIAGNLSVRDAELAMMRVARIQGPSIITRGDEPASAKVLMASLLMSCGMSDEKLAKDKDFGVGAESDKLISAAWPRRHITLQQVMAAALEADGVHAPHGGQALFDAVVGHAVRAGFSTIDLTGLIGTSGNKLLMDSFTTVDAVYPFVAQQVDVNNFLTYTAYRLNQTGAFAVLSPEGNLSHGVLTESAYTNKLNTSGMVIVLPRQAIVNDDQNAFQQLFRILGRDAALAVEDALMLKIMETSDVFYTAGQLNRITSNAFSEAGLAAAEAALAGMKDAKGAPIYARGKYVLVPPGLDYLARKIYTSASVQVVTSASTGQGEANVFAGKYQPKSSPYLAITTRAGGHATHWYFIADPDVLPAFQVAYLQGRRQPTVETADAEFKSPGMQWRCYFDFGVAQVDYRGAIKSSV